MSPLPEHGRNVNIIADEESLQVASDRNTSVAIRQLREQLSTLEFHQ